MYLRFIMKAFACMLYFHPFSSLSKLEIFHLHRNVAPKIPSQILCTVYIFLDQENYASKILLLYFFCFGLLSLAPFGKIDATI